MFGFMTNIEILTFVSTRIIIKYKQEYLMFAYKCKCKCFCDTDLMYQNKSSFDEHAKDLHEHTLYMVSLKRSVRYHFSLGVRKPQVV